jgi:hypothetical protein
MFDLDSITMTSIQSSMHLLIHISHKCKCYRRDHGVIPLHCMNDGSCCCASIWGYNTLHISSVNRQKPFTYYWLFVPITWHMFQHESTGKQQLPARYETRNPVSNGRNYSLHDTRTMSHTDRASRNQIAARDCSARSLCCLWNRLLEPKTEEVTEE